MNITESTPSQIDTEIARISTEIAKLRHQRDRIVENVLSYAGLRKYVAATWQTRRSSYQNTGTFEQGVDLLREHEVKMAAWRESGYDRDLMPARLSDYSGGVDVDKAIVDKAKLEGEISTLYKQMGALENEYHRRGRWTRMFLVTSSAGHIHSSTLCHTTKLTTTFGWMPDYSGLDEADLLAKLGTHAETACTVCYPAAPVLDRKKKLTVAKAEKLIAGPVLND